MLITLKSWLRKDRDDRTSWQCTLLKLKTFTKDQIQFRHVTPEWLEDIQKFILSEVSPITAWHYYSNIKYALNKAHKEKNNIIKPCTIRERNQKT